MARIAAQEAAELLAFQKSSTIPAITTTHQLTETVRDQSKKKRKRKDKHSSQCNDSKQQNQLSSIKSTNIITPEEVPEDFIVVDFDEPIIDEGLMKVKKRKSKKKTKKSELDEDL